MTLIMTYLRFVRNDAHYDTDLQVKDNNNATERLKFHRNTEKDGCLSWRAYLLARRQKVIEVRFQVALERWHVSDPNLKTSGVNDTS